jgi:hypothetical protein
MLEAESARRLRPKDWTGLGIFDCLPKSAPRVWDDEVDLIDRVSSAGRPVRMRRGVSESSEPLSLASPSSAFNSSVSASSWSAPGSKENCRRCFWVVLSWGCDWNFHSFSSGFSFLYNLLFFPVSFFLFLSIRPKFCFTVTYLFN